MRLVLDTNIILDHSLEEIIALYEQPCEVIIPIAVVQELDTFKNSNNDVLRLNARKACRFLDGLRTKGKLYDGVQLDSGHVIKVSLDCDYNFPAEIGSSVDARIIRTAAALDAKLITQDLNERIVADVLGVKAEDLSDGVDISNLYTGWTTITVSAERLQQFADNGRLVTRKRLYPNQFVLLVSESNTKQTMLARYNGQELVKLNYAACRAYGISPLNLEQRFLMDLLMDPSIKLVTAVGLAGTGKTLLALAAGLEQLENIGSAPLYHKMLVTRSPIPVGRDLGYLPGTEEEKLLPWLGAVFDSLEFITSNYAGSKDGRPSPKEAVSSLLSFGRIEFRAITYIRGRSIPQQYIIIDEATNLTPHEIKTIVSRAGEGTKIILVGDVQQIDNYRLSAENNGLVYLIEAFKGQSIYGHITLSKSERSELAELATKLL